jgi:hypothetical protein
VGMRRKAILPGVLVKILHASATAPKSASIISTETLMVSPFFLFGNVQERRK